MRGLSPESVRNWSWELNPTLGVRGRVYLRVEGVGDQISL